MLVAVAAVGVDRPGIVAAVTGVLMDRGANLEDTSMSILQGHFVMMLVVEVPDAVDPVQLERDLAEATAGFDLTVTVRLIAAVDGGVATEGRSSWTATVYGADHPGIVHGIASALAGVGANIVDLTTRKTDELYVMTVELELPPDGDEGQLRSALAGAARHLDVSCSVHQTDADVL